MDRQSKEYKRLEKVAIALVYTTVAALVLIGLAIVYILIAVAVNVS